MSLQSRLLPLTRLLPPEAAHRLTIRALAGMGFRPPAADDPILATKVLGIDFANPLGMAAGFDKDAEVVASLTRLGFGFVEVGTITPRPQPGNPKPRVFRLTAERGVINRYGFNSEGAEAAAARLAGLRDTAGGTHLVGINVGKNRDSRDAAADYAECVERLAPFADYLVVNVSSPNTPGLRALQSGEALTGLLKQVHAALPESAAPPLLLKIAPDLDQADRDAIAEVAGAGEVDGLIVSNTTVQRPYDLTSAARDESGGLSGKPLKRIAAAMLREMYVRTGGAVPIIGVGGISSGEDAYHRIRAGASLLQLYTALIYEGPDLIGRIKAELAALLRRDGFSSVADAVGADHRPAPRRVVSKGT